jgi:Icc-related predicted phosphoesterase
MARLTTIVCAADPCGSAEATAALIGAAEHHDAGAIAVVGRLGAPGNGPESLREVFRALGRSDRPAFWVPGPHDAPVGAYLREAHNTEVVFPSVHGVHGTAALSPGGDVVVAGIGGEITDEPDARREEVDRLRYPRWEAEYRLKILNEFPELERVLLFHSHPMHKGLGTEGSEAVAELIGTYRARIAVCGGERRTAMLGTTLVVAPGSARDGHYAVVDVQRREAEVAELAPAR